jgi:hypothetical protein
MPAEYEPTDAQRSLVENAAAFGLTGAGFVQYFDSRLAYSRTPGPRQPPSLSSICLERKERSDRKEYDRNDRNNACGGGSDLHHHCGELSGEYHAQEADDKR